MTCDDRSITGIRLVVRLLVLLGCLRESPLVSAMPPDLKPNYARLPPELRYVSAWADRYGITAEYDDRKTIAEAMTPDQRKALDAIAPKLRKDQDALQRWMDAENHSEAGQRVYWMFVFLGEWANEAPTTMVIHDAAAARRIAKRLAGVEWSSDPRRAEAILAALKLRADENGRLWDADGAAWQISRHANGGIRNAFFVMAASGEADRVKRLSGLADVYAKALSSEFARKDGKDRSFVGRGARVTVAVTESGTVGTVNLTLTPTDEKPNP